MYFYSIKYRFKIKCVKNHKKNENCVCVCDMLVISKFLENKFYINILIKCKFNNSLFEFYKVFILKNKD